MGVLEADGWAATTERPIGFFRAGPERAGDGAGRQSSAPARSTARLAERAYATRADAVNAAPRPSYGLTVEVGINATARGRGNSWPPHCACHGDQ